MSMVEDRGLRQRPTTAATAAAAAVPSNISSENDMAYGRIRPVLASTTTAASSGLPISRSFSSGGLPSNFNSNRVLRRYYNRILLVLAVTAVYTVFIYKSGMSTTLARSFVRPTVRGYNTWSTSWYGLW